jgi:hypothetical protein
VSERRRRRPKSKIVRIKGAADGGGKAGWKIVNEEEEEDRTENRALGDAVTQPERPRNCSTEGNSGTAVREKRLRPANKARGQARGQKLGEETGMPDTVEGA